ncbi:hypothetical protein V1509DRAFT_628470 [Lipomyces kononenkoae]
MRKSVLNIDRYRDYEAKLLVFSDSIRVSIQPSDPDFPFDLAYLHFILNVPTDYPATAPRLTVINTDVPRGYALNIEHGFADEISKPALGSMSLVQMIDGLNERLEEFLKAEKRETIKLVNVGRRNGNGALLKSSTGNRGSYSDWGFDENVISSLQISDSTASQNNRVAEHAATFTEPVLQEASARREREIRQLQSRLPGSKLFSTDEVTGDSTFTVPFDVANSAFVPVGLRNTSTVRLIVPKLYDLVPVTISFHSIGAPEARAVETNFGVHAGQHREFSLFAHMNFLVQNIQDLAAQQPSLYPIEEPAAAGIRERPDEEYRKPPEWDVLDDDDVDDDGDDYEDEFDDESDDSNWDVREDGESGGHHGNEENYSGSSDADQSDTAVEDVAPQQVSGNHARSDHPPLHGTSINLPGLRLNDIGVVECTTLSIVVKCLRCKTEAEIRDIKPGLASRSKSTICAKCSSELSVASFRAEFMHENMVRLGYIDLLGCTPTDILPSSFMPYCGSCSEPLPGTTGIAGLGLAQTMSTNCRSCHTKMSIFIPQVKFSRVSDEQQAPAATIVKKRTEARLGIVAGTALPFNGTCKHYKRSTRWFRFSCCNRVFPCDRCHNEQSDHADEHASRMICGMCSREQNYQPEVCAYCRHSFFRKNTGFWEGGRGTRDKVKMSRKDPRKYKRRPAPPS